MYANHYDGGASHFHGGGFMPSQATQTPDQAGSSKTRSSTTSTTVPLTIKQITEAFHLNDERADFLIDGMEPSLVKLLGRVLNKAERVTDVSFLLDDGTGSIEVTRWVSDSFDTDEMTKIENGMYVVLIGKLKAFQGKRHIGAHAVRPVQDLNQITLHFMECIHAHLDNSRKATAVPATTSAMNDMRAYQTLNVGTGASGDIREVVLSVFQEPASLARENGLHVNEIIRRLGLQEQKIREAIEYHVEVGNIYSTIDDDHYKSACNG
ncbi:Replication protein A 32 kDa subunit A [Rhynchospora pubera]|uniref:Replication protein A 32 kDa subunit A n=1 Tax=Rhynchospora pubera TaxID=906938 RepID=A0AAV8GC34_9POAL|nr:Replication protein A 32 kDa subunit A [Rhynchospora pubera]